MTVQLTVVLPPVVIVVGFTVTVTTGTAITVSVAVFVSDPAVLEHLSVKVYEPAVFMAPVPKVPLAPGEDVDQPGPVPLGTQLVGALVALQLIVALLPVPIEAGAAEIVTTGTLAVVPPAVTLVLVEPLPVPPAFVQLNENVYV